MKITVTTTSQDLQTILNSEGEGENPIVADLRNRAYTTALIENKWTVSIYYDCWTPAVIWECTEIKPLEFIQNVNLNYFFDQNLISETSNNDDIIFIIN